MDLYDDFVFYVYVYVLILTESTIIYVRVHQNYFFFLKKQSILLFSGVPFNIFYVVQTFCSVDLVRTLPVRRNISAVVQATEKI